MKKDKEYWDRYIKYLGQLALLNHVRNIDFINDKEYIKIKQDLINDYKVQDIVEPYDG